LPGPNFDVYARRNVIVVTNLPFDTLGEVPFVELR